MYIVALFKHFSTACGYKGVHRNVIFPMQYLKGISLLEANVSVQLYCCTCLCPSAFLDVTEALVSRLARVQCQELQVLFLVRSPEQWIKLCLCPRPIELQCPVSFSLQNGPC